MAITVTLPLALLACGGDAETSGDAEEVTRQLEGIAGLAVGAYATSGPVALLDYLSRDVLANCSANSIERAMADQPQPIGFREVKEVQTSGDEAKATVVITSEDGEEDQPWKFVRNETSWRIQEIPGLENCES
jgi:hypothetical protein